MLPKSTTRSFLDDAEELVARQRARQYATILADSRAAIARAQSLCNLAHAQMLTYRALRNLTLSERRLSLAKRRRFRRAGSFHRSACA
jgi:hypothetical protein